MRKPIPASKRKIWMYVYTAAAVTITIGGSLYGAELATKQQKKKLAQKEHEATFDEKIQALQTARGILVSKKNTVEKQLHELEERIAERARKGIPSTSNGSREQPK
ncbi:hypothetical protein TMatcc_001544 [Talaromyces marneffei ATCC 18224]|uniref:Uncharacterized protein n=1 Tax=Talaromyces marneffei (strain ATCC 18224 / CBS 334.59 / QM 7333) TaxID=441960 RepID=B6QH56_TALMQ|nr:uncharacterized protein EYB26_007230 [Talaromyces marneffei]EEA22701.1 conserved hypothetical protein [Talaromyces marneffei ATCC 18224]KAE8551588.1 hypothetical protein EYB25_005478 [Talaromyces marneffei]QGA19541.1 hypothetical protein EYB26_007230 [Talaromyces marneffei]